MKPHHAHNNEKKRTRKNQIIYQYKCSSCGAGFNNFWKENKTKRKYSKQTNRECWSRWDKSKHYGTQKKIAIFFFSFLVSLSNNAKRTKKQNKTKQNKTKLNSHRRRKQNLLFYLNTQIRSCCVSCRVKVRAAERQTLAWLPGRWRDGGQSEKPPCSRSTCTCWDCSARQGKEGAPVKI